MLGDVSGRQNGDGAAIHPTLLPLLVVSIRDVSPVKDLFEIQLMLIAHHMEKAMDLRQIEYVVAVARTGHVTQAARELRVAQSALSRQIQQVERELGVRLFDRSTRRLRPTAAGEAFVARGDRLLADVRALHEEMQRFRGPHRGRVTIGALPLVAEQRLPALLCLFHALYPGVELALREDNTMPLLALLEAGQLDLAVVHQLKELFPNGLPTGLVAEPLFVEELVLIVASDHALALMEPGPGPVSLHALREETFIAFKPGSGLRPTLLQSCAGVGFEPRIAVESGEVSSVRALVSAGLGIALVPRSAVEASGPPVRIVALEAPAPSRTVSLVWRDDGHRSATATAVLRVARQHFSHDTTMARLATGAIADRSRDA